MRTIRTLKIVAIAAAVAAALVGTASAASAATGVTGVTVSSTSYLPSASGTYTIRFRNSTTATPALGNGSGTITLSTLSGSFPTTAGAYTVDAQGNSGPASSVTPGASSVTLTVPSLIGTSGASKGLPLGGANTIITVTVAGVTNPTTAGNYTVNVSTSSDTTAVLSAPYTIGTASQLVASGGSGQSTQVGTAFPKLLGASLKDSAVIPNPVDQAGISVTFTATPGPTGASGTFNGLSSVTVTTNESGLATSPLAYPLTANGIAGAFTVTATGDGLTSLPYSETNVAAPVTPPTTTPPTTTPPPATSPSDHGYWLVGGDGGIFTFGSAAFHGSTGSLKLSRPVVGITPTSSRQGYWLDASDGGVFAFGDAVYYGSVPQLGILPAGSPAAGRKLAAPVVGMVPSSTGHGYFMVAADGGVFAFGDAVFAGSCPSIGGCSGAAVAVMPDASGLGYWLVTTTGHVYAFGDAPFLGAPGSVSSPVTSAGRTASGNGYWILLANGTVLSYGDAANLGGPVGSASALRPATAIFATATGGGYWVALSDGSIFTYGDAPYDGGMNGTHLNAPIIAATGW